MQKKAWAKPKAVETAAAMEINCYVSCSLAKS
ncbi:MAG: pyrroloquinoline quinone precursor peptide PqqA [Alphaproteobacteria bacterium]|nr:pyrroloquinoline quinone precursor peptide PqqA [Alphaproteobacteria bacterium]